MQVLAGASVLAVHPLNTPERILLQREHFEGPTDGRVLPPQPLGKLGRRLEEIAMISPEARPLDPYAALAEAAR